MTTRFTVAAQLLGYLAWRQGEDGDTWVSSDELSRCIQTHSIVVRRVMADLRQARLVETRRGSGGGCRLARAAEDIRLGDVFTAVRVPEESLVAFPTVAVNQKHDVDRHIETVLRDIVQRSELAFVTALNQVTIAEFTRQVVSIIFEEKGISCPNSPPPP